MSSCGFLCRCGCGQPCGCLSSPIIRQYGWREERTIAHGQLFTKTVLIDLFEDGSEVPEGYDWVAHHVRVAGDIPIAAKHPAPARGPLPPPITCNAEGCRFALGHTTAHEARLLQGAAE